MIVKHRKELRPARKGSAEIIGDHSTLYTR